MTERYQAGRFWGHMPSRHSFAFPFSKVLHDVLAIIDLPEVCPLSGRCKAPIPHITREHSLSPASFAPLPKGVSCDQLACGGICRREEGFTTFRISHTSRVGCSLYPDSLSVPVTASGKRLTDCVPFWLRPISMFGLFRINGACGCSLLFTLPAQPGTLPRYARSHAFPSQDRLIGLRCLVGFVPGIAHHARNDRLRNREVPVPLTPYQSGNNDLNDFVSHAQVSISKKIIKA